MTGVTGLRGLLAQTPPGPWRSIPQVSRGIDAYVRAADDKTVATGLRTDKVADLIALTPDMARLLVHVYGQYAHQFDDETLARFAEIDRRAAQ